MVSGKQIFSVIKRKSWLITFSSIVTRLGLLGIFMFSLFGVSWVLPFSMRELLSSWHGSFVGRKRKKFWWPALCVGFGRSRKKGTIGHSIIKSCLIKELNLLFFVIFGCGPNCLWFWALPLL